MESKESDLGSFSWHSTNLDFTRDFLKLDSASGPGWLQGLQLFASLHSKAPAIDNLFSSWTSPCWSSEAAADDDVEDGIGEGATAAWGDGTSDDPEDDEHEAIGDKGEKSWWWGVDTTLCGHVTRGTSSHRGNDLTDTWTEDARPTSVT